MPGVRELPIIIKSEGHQLVAIHHTSGQKYGLLLCHGLTGDKTEDHRLFVHTARKFAEEGYDVLRFDFWGSGDSEGDFKQTRMSHHLANISDAMNFFRQYSYDKVAVLAISFGAAAAILAAADVHMDALILWSAVPDTHSLLTEHLNVNLTQVPENTVITYNNWEMETAFIDDLLKFDIKRAFSEIEIPTLVIQGMQDAPLFQNGFNTFRDIATPPCDFMELPQASHTFSAPRHRKQVIRQSLIWLNRQFKRG